MPRPGTSTGPGTRTGPGTIRARTGPGEDEENALGRASARAARPAGGEAAAAAVHVRPHARCLLAPALVLLLTSPAAAYLAAVVPAGRWQGVGRLAVAAAALAVVLRWSVLPFLTWWATRYTLTSSYVAVSSGLLSRSSRRVPLHAVVEVACLQSPGARVWGSGTLVVEAVGEPEPLVLDDVPRVRRLQRALHELADAAVDEGGASADASDEAGR